MSEWATHTLGDIVETNRKITYGIVQPGPDVSPDGIPLIRGKDYSSGKVSTEGLYHVLPEIDAPFQRSKVKGGDLLLSIAGYVGKAAIVPDVLAGANLTQTTARLSIDEVKASNKYVFYVLNSEEFEIEVKKYEKGSAQSGLNLGDVEKFKVRLPDCLLQQQKIAHILTTVDNLIEKTQALIDKYTAVKQGMMHDLFTRGIDLATGQLRSSYEQAPELYKETELGWVPREWEIRRMDSLYKEPIRDFGSFSLTNLIRFVENGIPFIKSESVKDGYIDNESLSYITEDVHRLLNKSIVRKGDILFTKIGAMGRVAIYDGSLGICNSNAATAKISANEKLVGAFYLSLFIGCERTTREFEKNIISTPPRINLGDINKMMVPLPPVLEQDLVCDSLKSLHDSIVNEDKFLAKLKIHKKGLMQDLLTGRVMVA